MTRSVSLGSGGTCRERRAACRFSVAATFDSWARSIERSRQLADKAREAGATVTAYTSKDSRFNGWEITVRVIR